MLAVAAALLLAGCGGDDEPTATDTDTVTLPARATPGSTGCATARCGPRSARSGVGRRSPRRSSTSFSPARPRRRSTDLDFTTAIPEDADGGVARSRTASRPSSSTDELTDEALAQVVYTLTQFPTVESVEIQGKTLHPGRLRGADACDPRRVAAAVRGRHEPAPRHGHREHLRGDVQLRAHRHRRPHRRRELRHRDLGNGHARHVRLHDRAVHRPLRRGRLAHRLRALGQGRLADQPRRDPPSDVAVAAPAA